MHLKIYAHHYLSLYISRSVTSTVFTFFFFNDTATTEIYTLSLHDALPIFDPESDRGNRCDLEERGVLRLRFSSDIDGRSEEHTSELQSHVNLVCRLLLEKKKKRHILQAKSHTYSVA